MRITSFSRDQIREGIDKQALSRRVHSNSVRILFSPFRIDSSSFKTACTSYSVVKDETYDTVVVLESHPGGAEKKLPMPSNKSFSTPLGDVPVNDRLRNDFADEDDDFFVTDDAFDENVSIYDQLMLLQCTVDSFDVLSIQITEESTFIIKELVASISEILRNKNVLLVCCTNLPVTSKDEIQSLSEMARNNQFSSMMNYMNNGESDIEGVSTFLTGLLVAAEWNLDVSFTTVHDRNTASDLFSAHAQLQTQPTHG